MILKKDIHNRFQEFLAESEITTSCPDDDRRIVAFFRKEMNTLLEGLKGEGDNCGCEAEYNLEEALRETR